MNQSKYKEPKRGSEEINEDFVVKEFRKSAKQKRRKLTLHDRRKGGTKRYL